jgi:Ni,Fe-hydrogenase I small subunit
MKQLADTKAFSEKESCKHTRIRKEYYLGTHIGYICVDCREDNFHKEAFHPKKK